MQQMIVAQNKQRWALDGKNLDTHELFSEHFPNLSLSKIHSIVEELGQFNTSLDDIVMKMKNSILQFHDSHNCLQDAHLNSVLQETNSTNLVHFIFFLAQVPQGLFATDLSHLCVLEPQVFGIDK